MKVVEYTEAFSDRLDAAIAKADFDVPLLSRPQYVRHMFLRDPHSRLQLLLSTEGAVVATLGSEYVRMQSGSRSLAVAILSNTYSFEPGAVTFLLHRWMKTCEIGILFPGNLQMRQLIARQKRWVQISGLRTLWLNWDYPVFAHDPLWKRLAKPVISRATRVDAGAFGSLVSRGARGAITVRNEDRIPEDLPRWDGGFGLKLSEGADYLNWRFDTALDYVRYRLFSVWVAGSRCGAVVLAEWPHCVVVSYCDGDDPDDLAGGVLLAIAEVNQGEHRYRKVLLSAIHARMRQAFERAGFRPDPVETPFYMASFGDQSVPESEGDWLLNLEFGDAGAMFGLVYTGP